MHTEISDTVIWFKKSFQRKAMPDIIGYELITNENFKLSGRIGRPTLIYLWSYSCGPCIKEFDNLNKLVENYSNKIDFYSICSTVEVGKEFNINKLRTFLEQRPINFNHIVLDKDNSTLNTYGFPTPTYIFIDSNGNLKEVFSGSNRYKLKKEIKGLF
jgi:thiol-disulfide isomerase/thioredoxin